MVEIPRPDADDFTRVVFTDARKKAANLGWKWKFKGGEKNADGYASRVASTRNIEKFVYRQFWYQRSDL